MSALIFAAIYFNNHFKVRNINVTFFDDKTENSDIKNFTQNLVQQNADTFLKYIFLSEDDMTKKVHGEFEIVSSVDISKNFNMDLNVVVTKNEEFFYTCVPDSLGFLAPCMLGNTDGEYYAQLDATNYSDSSTTASTTVPVDPEKIRIDINPKVLYDANTSQQIDSPDSLSGARIYTDEDFKVLREMLKWVQKEGFTIKKVYVDELKIVSIYTDEYIIKISLDKGFVDTVRDFELISRTGNLEKYINDDKNKIDYIDLSYKNKVFYKLKGATQTSTTTTDFISVNSTATTSTSSTTGH